LPPFPRDIFTPSPSWSSWRQCGGSCLPLTAAARANIASASSTRPFAINHTSDSGIALHQTHTPEYCRSLARDPLMIKHVVCDNNNNNNNNNNKVWPRRRRDDSPPPRRWQFNGGKNRGGPTSVCGRVRSPHISGGWLRLNCRQPACP